MYFNQRRIEQINGREGETATLFLHCPLNLNELVGGFAPRHLNRWAASLISGKVKYRMRKLTASCFILSIALLLIFSPSLGAQNRRAPKHTVSFNSFGPAKIGMTVSQAAKVLGVPVTRDAGYEGNDCYYASPKRGFKDIAFMMSGQRIVRIDIDSKEYATDRGARVGDTEAQIKRLYKGKVKVSQHPYVDNGHYLEVEFGGGKYSLIFETDGKRVTRFRAGRSPEVGYIEGCS